jgi:nitrogen-specific signal transduction histidine kinase
MQSLPGSSRWLAATLSPEALITSLSSGAEQFTGYSAQELAGMPVTRILDDSSAFEVPFILKSAKEWGSWGGEIVHRDRGGNLLKARGTLTVLGSREGYQCGYLLISNFDSLSAPAGKDGTIATDIAAKLRVIAHDLNNPLAVMMGYAQLLILDENCPEKIRTDIEKLYSELQRIIPVVERLRSCAISLCGTTPANLASAEMPIRTSA